MWDLLQSIQEQVTRYSTWIGQLWYLCVFLFRLFVVVTIGGAVYGDELGEFECNTKELGCTKMCFNQYSKISHLRFWAFQLLAVTTPTVLFHFFSLSVTGQIAKVEAEEKKLKEENQIDDMRSMVSAGPPSIEEGTKTMKKIEKLEKRTKKIGTVKKKAVYNKGQLTEIAYTTKVHGAYYASIIARMVLEAVFIVLAYRLFRFMDGAKPAADVGPMDFLTFEVPSNFICLGKDDPSVQTACGQVMMLDQLNGRLGCWISRPYEKTILIQYMNYLSAICFLLSAVELIYIPIRAFIKRYHKSSRETYRRNRLGYSGDDGYRNQYATHTFSPAPSYRPPQHYPGNHSTGMGYVNEAASASMGPARMKHNDAISVAPSTRSMTTLPPTMNNIAMHNQRYPATGNGTLPSISQNIAPSEFTVLRNGAM